MNWRKAWSSLAKAAVSAVFLYLVIVKIDFRTVWALIGRGNPFYIAAALLVFIWSQWVSSNRLLIYFKANRFHLSPMSNHRLYLVGMFYNFFIPGGIGGDAYKVYVLHKRFDWGVKALGISVLNDRISGFVAIVILIEILLAWAMPGNWLFLVPIGCGTTLLVAYMALGRFFPGFKTVFFHGLGYSLVVQMLQLCCVYLILLALLAHGDVPVYLLVFLISAVLSVISFSGIGVREWLFLQAAQLYAFDAETAVSVALLFSFLTALVSLVGLAFQIKTIPLKRTDSAA